MVARNLPPQYAGWQQHEPDMRRMTTPELILEIQDGPPDRRLAAMSVIDLAEVSTDIIRDWIRALPVAEANELAGAIPAQRPHARVDDDLRWVELARFGYDRRRLATFLVMLTASLESLEAKDPEVALQAWQETGEWLVPLYGELELKHDEEALNDVSLFLFESYLDREPLFEAFHEVLLGSRSLARRVSTNPGIMLVNLPGEMQRRALEAAEKAGGLPLEESWRLLHEPMH